MEPNQNNQNQPTNPVTPELTPAEPAPVSPKINPPETQALPSPVANPPEPAVTAAPTSAGTPPVATPPKPKWTKKQFMLAGAVALFVASVLGYIFGFYLPKQPDYVWSSGLSNSGKAITSVVDNLTEEEKLEKLKRTELVISAEVTGDGYDYTGSLNSKFDSTKSSTSASLKAGDRATQKVDLSAEFLTEVPAGKIYPDVYFKLTGLKTIEFFGIGSTFGAYDGKWIHASSDYLESIYDSEQEKKEAQQEPVNSGEVADFVKTVSDTSREYLFTSDKDKAVLVNKGFKGEEQVDGVPTFKYEVGIDKQHAKDFCKALTIRLADLSLTKKLSSNDEEAVKKIKDDAQKDCDDMVNDSIKDDETLEAWVNTKHRIMHKIRKYGPSDKTTYSEVGQIYKGGDNLSVFFAYHEDGEQLDTKLVLDLNAKDIISKGTFTATKKTDSQYEVKATIEVKPHSGEVKVDKPGDAVDIQELFGAFGGGYSSAGGGSSSSADTESQTDIKAMHGQIEAYYAQFGAYPTLAQLNDTSWRQENMPGLDDEALRTPSGTAKALAATASKSQYGYTPAGCSADGCQTYTLEALLENGQKYTKQSLN